MAKSKTTTARPRAKHAKPRATAKPPARKKAVAKKATPSKAAKRTPVKRTSVKPRRSTILKAIEPPHVEPAVEAIESPEIDVAVDAIVDEGSGAAKKPGALARLKSGVGNLFARMTGRANPKDSLESDGVPRDDRTLEIVTGDIILQRDADAPSRSVKGGRKTPPPPPAPSAETGED